MYPPDTTDSYENYKWLVKSFVPKVHETLKYHNAQSGTMLMGLNGELWSFYDNYSVIRCKEGYHSVGSGNEFAKGAIGMYMTMNKPESDKELIAAISHSIDLVGQNCTTVSRESTVSILEPRIIVCSKDS